MLNFLTDGAPFPISPFSYSVLQDPSLSRGMSSSKWPNIFAVRISRSTGTPVSRETPGNGRSFAKFIPIPTQTLKVEPIKLERVMMPPSLVSFCSMGYKTRVIRSNLTLGNRNFVPEVTFVQKLYDWDGLQRPSKICIGRRNSLT